MVSERRDHLPEASVDLHVAVEVEQRLVALVEQPREQPGDERAFQLRTVVHQPQPEELVVAQAEVLRKEDRGVRELWELRWRLHRQQCQGHVRVDGTEGLDQPEGRWQGRRDRADV